MNDTQIHPEDLLDRAKHQTLDGGDERLLRAHLDGCAACRFELSLAPALYRHIRLDAGDHALIARAIKKTRDLQRAERSPMVWRRMPAAAALAVALLAGAVMASAAGYVWHRRDTIVVEELPSKARQRSATQRDVTRARPTVVPLASTSSPAPTVTEAPEAAAPAPTAHRRSIAVNSASSRCADEFRKAGQLRRAGAAAEAAMSYQTLRGICPGSSEELAARVLAGRIYLDRLSSPMLALSAFDSYLAAAPHGALLEDAVIGRALALGRLHRSADEIAAWEDLLATFPDSLYADQARTRMKTLR
jgi:hypothetical protein